MSASGVDRKKGNLYYEIALESINGYDKVLAIKTGYSFKVIK